MARERHTTTHTRDPERTKQAILDAAEQLFCPLRSRRQ